MRGLQRKGGCLGDAGIADAVCVVLQMSAGKSVASFVWLKFIDHLCE